jgi:hypothetical protein
MNKLFIHHFTKQSFCLHFILLLLSGFTNVLFGQQNNAPDSFIQYRFNGFIRLQNKEKVKLQGINYFDSNQIKIFTKRTHPLEENGTIRYTYKGDPRTMETQILPIENIKILKANRHSFLKGAGFGGSIGAGIGIKLANLAYKVDTNPRDGLAIASLPFLFGIPLATIGAIGGVLFVERRFAIKGNQEKLQEALDKTYQ